MHHRQFILVFLVFLSHSLSGQVTLTTYAGIAKTSTSIGFLDNPDPVRVMYLNDQYGSIGTPFLGLQIQAKLNKFFLFNVDF